MTKDQQVNAALPDFPGDIPSVAVYRSMTALEKFVYDWQPGNSSDELWRNDLTDVIKEALAPPTPAPADAVLAALESCVEAMEMKQRVTMWGSDGDRAKFNVALEAARRALEGKT